MLNTSIHELIQLCLKATHTFQTCMQADTGILFPVILLCDYKSIFRSISFKKFGTYLRHFDDGWVRLISLVRLVYGRIQWRDKIELLYNNWIWPFPRDQLTTSFHQCTAKSLGGGGGQHTQMYWRLLFFLPVLQDVAMSWKEWWTELAPGSDFLMMPLFLYWGKQHSALYNKGTIMSALWCHLQWFAKKMSWRSFSGMIRPREIL